MCTFANVAFNLAQVTHSNPLFTEMDYSSKEGVMYPTIVGYRSDDGRADELGHAVRLQPHNTDDLTDLNGNIVPGTPLAVWVRPYLQMTSVHFGLRLRICPVDGIRVIPTAPVLRQERAHAHLLA